MRLPRIFTSSAAAATSASVIQLVCESAPGTKLSPDRLSLMLSTPYFKNLRTILRMSSAPLTLTPKLNSGKGRCGSVSSPRPPGTVISWLAAR